jgi:hypothetical protein
MIVSKIIDLKEINQTIFNTGRDIILIKKFLEFKDCIIKLSKEEIGDLEELKTLCLGIENDVVVILREMEHYDMKSK